MNTDVVALAKERQARLTAEIGKLDSFIRMAVALLKHAPKVEERMPTPIREPKVEERMPAPVRELTVEERMPDHFNFWKMVSSK